MSVPITLQKLHKQFGSTVAVDQVDLTIPAGSLFFLLGPSGCGKTTLLRMLAGFTEPTSGEIRFGDRNVTQLPANQRNCGMVFQGYALWPHMTVAQNVAFGLTVRKVPPSVRQQQVQAALEQVQMGALADRRPNQLSGGQQQRVALARALVIRPTLLLLDEPLSNLDAKLRLDMRSQIREICKAAGITAVYVTHDQKEALSMADKVAVMQHGRVMQVGSPRQVYDRPGSRFVADFLGETNFLPARITGSRDDLITLSSDAGELISRACQGGCDGGAVTCSIRPEAIGIVRDPAPASAQGACNRLTARVKQSVYLGDTAQHELIVGRDLVWRVTELNPRLDALSPGENVQLVIDPRDVVVLPR